MKNRKGKMTNRQTKELQNTCEKGITLRDYYFYHRGDKRFRL